LSKRVVQGCNDFNTIYPNYSIYLKNKDDGNYYVAHSNHKVWWKCPECGYEFYQSFNKFVNKINKCSVCGDTASYGEKFISCMLKQLGEEFHKEKRFEWSKNKRYDFYLPNTNIILEINGKQHYIGTFINSVRSLEDEKNNDKNKMELALVNGINKQKYIVIDYIKSGDKNSLINNILQSNLRLYFDFTSIDWNKCDLFAITYNSVKNVCQIYESGIYDIKEILRMTEYSSLNTIRDKLKYGAKLGWCSYTPEKGKQRGILKVVDNTINHRNKEVVMLSLDDKIIRHFHSIQEAQRIMQISHIWDCCIGKRKSAGGYKWRYKNENK
jgi:hypothetical protein